MKTLPRLICSGLLMFCGVAQATSVESNDPAMEHYVFTYDYEKTQDPIRYQYRQTRQELSYILALDIQRQVLSNLSQAPDNLYASNQTSSRGNVQQAE